MSNDKGRGAPREPNDGRRIEESLEATNGGTEGCRSQGRPWGRRTVGLLPPPAYPLARASVWFPQGYLHRLSGIGSSGKVAVIRKLSFAAESGWSEPPGRRQCGRSGESLVSLTSRTHGFIRRCHGIDPRRGLDKGSVVGGEHRPITPGREEATLLGLWRAVAELQRTASVTPLRTTGQLSHPGLARHRRSGPLRIAPLLAPSVPLP